MVYLLWFPLIITQEVKKWQKMGKAGIMSVGEIIGHKVEKMGEGATNQMLPHWSELHARDQSTYTTTL